MGCIKKLFNHLVVYAFILKSDDSIGNYLIISGLFGM